ncbi:glutamate 5-kinase [uncultured Algimonas sp.]|uniref:glutamate 5-kinase n=1 Tax=uncultured Algimonas sp. TaxID=1547920 RepID=UPI002610F401|nr:glutamate 5-kinase [uncultured Algimonas sp.]
MVASVTGLNRYRRIVVKVGSALLIEGGALRRAWLTRLCSDIANLKSAGAEVVLVSSGAVALGCPVLGLDRAKLSLAQKQACAAAGQSRLTRAYDDALGAFGLRSAQALLTLDDTEDRRRWLNARAALRTLVDAGVVLVVNENDTVATAEIRYGDNDRLAARTAQMIGADMLVLLSDVDGLYTADPRLDSVAEHIPVVERLTDDVLAMGGEANKRGGVGSGGMATKLLAARICMDSGCDMIVCDGRPDNPLGRLAGGARHSLFKSQADPISARAQWIRGSLAPSGRFVVDQGAQNALGDGRSLLAAGLVSVSGTFSKGDTVCVVGADGCEIAHGLSAYDSPDLPPLCGLRSDEIDHPYGPVVIHRDNLVML